MRDQGLVHLLGGGRVAGDGLDPSGQLGIRQEESGSLGRRAGRGLLLLLVGRLLRRLAIDDGRDRTRRLGGSGSGFGGLDLAARADVADARGVVAGRDRQGLLGLGRLLQEVGHRGHPVRRDVLEDLEHLGPSFEVADAELGVPHGLLDQVLARHHQARQPSAVGPLGRGLGLDLLADVGPVDLLGGHRPELLVGLVELHLAVADLERLAVPLAQLLGQPDGVLLGAEDEQGVGRRDDPRPARQVILDEDPEGDRLRLDPERLRRESTRDFQGLLVGAAGHQDPVAGRGRSDALGVEPLPGQADSLDAEIVLGVDLEVEQLGVDHDLLTRQILDHQARGLVVAAGDLERERLLAGQAEAVAPAELEVARAVDRDRRARRRHALGRLRDAINPGRGQLAPGGRRERRVDAFDQGDRAAPDVLLHRAGPAEVLGEGDAGHDRGQLGSEHRLDLDDPRSVAHADLDLGVGDLRGELEVVLAVDQLRDHGRAVADPGLGLGGPLGGRLGERHREDERLAVRDHDLVGERLQGGEGVSRGVIPGGDEPLEGVRCRRRDHREQSDRDRGGDGQQAHPELVARGRHGVAEVALLGVERDLLDRRLDEPARPSLLGIVVGELDHAEQLVADPGVLAGQEPCELLGQALAPDPSIEGIRDDRAGQGDEAEKARARPIRRVPEPVEDVHRQEGRDDAEGRRAGSLDGLDGPDPTTEVV